MFFYYLAWGFLAFTIAMIGFTLFLGWQNWRDERREIEAARKA